MSFVHLQVISAYSLLQTTTRIEDLVRSAKTKGYQAIALTDQNVLYGQVDFFKLVKSMLSNPFWASNWICPESSVKIALFRWSC